MGLRSTSTRMRQECRAEATLVLSLGGLEYLLALRPLQAPVLQASALTAFEESLFPLGRKQTLF
jgi:hypothetical protein